MIWKFYLRDPLLELDFTEVEEPEGWDAFEETLQRSDLYTGLDNTFSDNLIFTETGSVYMQDKFDLYRFDGHIDFKAELWCNDVLSDTLTGIINMISYTNEQGRISVKFEDTSFQRKFLNRINTPVNLTSGLSIEGIDIGVLDRESIIAHSKVIQNIGKYGATPDPFLNAPDGAYTAGLHTITSTVTNDISESVRTYENSYCQSVILNNRIAVDIQTSIADVSSMFQSTTYPTDDQDIQNDLVYTLTTNGKLSVTGKLRYQFYKAIDVTAISSTNATRDTYCEMNAFLYLKVGSASPILLDSVSTVFQNETINTILTPLTNQEVLRGDAYFEFDSGQIDAIIGDQIHLYIKHSSHLEVDRPDPGGAFTIDINQYGFFFEDFSEDEKSIVTFLFESVSDPSVIKGYKIYEVLNKVVESITDRTDAIRSDFFGRIDSLPESYDETGCGAEVLYTNGLNIRNMLNNSDNPFDITASFSQVFNALNVIDSIGLGIEKIGGIPYIRIEPKEYFYNNASIYSFTNVSDLIISVATDYIWNEIEIGYNKWEVEEINGIDEFNTKRVYVFPVKNINKRLQLTTDIVTGGYAIESTRRQQYHIAPTTDNTYDSDPFLISLNRIAVTFDTEEDNPYAQDGDVYPITYPIGTITERDESFDQVLNIFSPSTAYNIRFSPARCAVNNYRAICGTISHDPGLPLKFQSGTGNTTMLTESSEECDHVNGSISENQDIIPDNIDTDDKFAYFEPVILDFSYPMTRSEFQLIKNSINKSVLVSCGVSQQYQATIKEIKYQQNSQGGIVFVKALNSPCISGAFDSGFDDGFDTGSC